MKSEDDTFVLTKYANAVDESMAPDASAESTLKKDMRSSYICFSAFQSKQPDQWPNPNLVRIITNIDLTVLTVSATCTRNRRV